ncbi:MAG: S8 family serine peptidase [Candidatus Woesearchaeota archaeon]
MRKEGFNVIVILLLVFALILGNSFIVSRIGNDISGMVIQQEESFAQVQQSAPEPDPVYLSEADAEAAKLPFELIPEYGPTLERTDDNLLNALGEDGFADPRVDKGNISVIIVLKDQPLSKISKEHKEVTEKKLESKVKELDDLNKKTQVLSEEEILAMGHDAAMEIESAALTEDEKTRHEELTSEIESEMQIMRQGILNEAEEKIKPSQDKVQKRIEKCGGKVRKNLRIMNALSVDIPKSCLWDLQKEGEIAGVYENTLTEAQLNVSVPSMRANLVHARGYTGGIWDLAVIDTGIDGSHPALTVDYAKTFHPSWYERLFISYDDNPDSTNDYQGHGTHVAGIIASTDPVYRGVAYGLDKLINVKAGFRTGSGGGSMFDDDMMDGADWAIYTAGADVLSYSFGSGHSSSDDCSSCRFFDAIVDELDVLIAVSAGNDGPNDDTVGTPAIAYNIFSVASVYDYGTTDRGNDLVSSFSSRGYSAGGRIKPDIAAPGSSILSANNKWETESDFVSKSGTSMACPHVSAAAILALDMTGLRNPSALKALLLNTAQSNGTFADKRDYGWGYIDIDHAYAHRYNLFTSTVAENGGYKLYKGHLDAGEKVTLVWNRHVDYVGSSFPSTYYTLNDLDLYLYDANTNSYRDGSAAVKENVEQVESSGSYDVVVKVKGYTSNFYHGLNTEEYGLAAEDGFYSTSKPTVTGYVYHRTTVYDNELPFQINVTVTNSGGTNAHNSHPTLYLPAGLTVYSIPSSISPVSAYSSKKATWLITATNLGTKTGIYATYGHNSYGIYESGTTSTTSVTILDDDTSPPYFYSWVHVSSIYGDQSIPVTANIVDDSGLGTVNLTYDYDNDGNPEGTIIMGISNLRAFGTIPAPDKSYETKTMSFTVTAQDNDNDRTGDSLSATSSKRYVTIRDDDTSAPAFSGWQFTDTGDVNDPIPVTVTITDGSGLSYATLYYDYGADGKLNGSVQLSQSGNSWSGIIPAPGPDYLDMSTTFFVEAQDNDNDRIGDNITINSSVQNISLIDDDTAPPSFDAWRFSSTAFGIDELEVNATISDESGLSSVKLYYDYEADGIDDNIVMSQDGNYWLGTIPAPGNARETKDVVFFVEAIDADDDPSGLNSSNFTIAVLDDDTEDPSFDVWNFTQAVLADSVMEVFVNVSDESGINYSKVYYDYGDDGSIDGNVIMTMTGPFWNATIPAAGNAYEMSNVSFIIEAQDDDNDRPGDNQTKNSTSTIMQVLDDDDTTPEINDINHSGVTIWSDAVPVTANLTDASGISGATLYYDYGDDGSIDGTVGMDLNGGLWNGTIPASAGAYELQNISFIIEAEDGDSDRAGDSSIENSSEQYILVTDDDTSYPVFNSFDYPDISNYTSTINVTVNLTDTSGIEYAKIYYIHGASFPAYSSMMMSQDGDMWSATLPAPGPLFQGTYTYFTIEVNDGDDDIADDSLRFNSSTQYILVSDPIAEIRIHSPAQSAILTVASVLFNITVSEPVDWLNMSNDSSQFNNLCTSCDSFTTTTIMDEGVHNIHVKAADSTGNISEATATFTIDLNGPVIHNYNRGENITITGRENITLTVNYTEAFIDRVVLKSNILGVHELIECPSGIAQTCSYIEDLSTHAHGTTIDYNFTAYDIAGREVTLLAAGDHPYLINIDRNSPVITASSPVGEVGYNFSLVVTTDENADMDYTLDGNTPVLLCSYCDSANVEFENLSISNHSMTVDATDIAGNHNSTSWYFAVLSDLDHDGIPDKDDDDDDNDGVIDINDPLLGNRSHVNTTFENISIDVNNSGNLSKQFSGVLNVSFKNNDQPILEFRYNFSGALLNLSNFTIKRQESSTKGSLLVRGIDLGTDNKTVYIDDLDAGISTLCIKDADIESISDISADCSGTDEYYISCPGTIGNYTCALNGTRYRVSGLRHSGVIELLIAVITPSGGGGGGSSAVSAQATIVPTAAGQEITMSTTTYAQVLIGSELYPIQISSIGTADVRLLMGNYYYTFTTFDNAMSVDVDKDGQRDITIELISVEKFQATLRFLLYARPAPIPVLPPGSVSRETMTEAPAPVVQATAPAVATGPDAREEIPIVTEKPAQATREAIFDRTAVLLVGLGLAMTIMVSVLFFVFRRRMDKKSLQKVQSYKREEKIAPEEGVILKQRSAIRRAEGKDAETIHNINDEIEQIKRHMGK